MYVMRSGQSCDIAYQSTETRRAVSFVTIANDRKLKYTRVSMFPPFTPIYVISADFFQFPATASTGFPRAFVRFEIKLRLWNQGGVGSDNVDPRIPCEEYLSININDLGDSIHNAENYIITAKNHTNWNVILIIGNLHNSHLICDLICNV